MIKMLEFDKIENPYEGNIAHHLNLICMGCGGILDFPKTLPITSKEVEKRIRIIP